MIFTRGRCVGVSAVESDGEGELEVAILFSTISNFQASAASVRPPGWLPTKGVEYSDPLFTGRLETYPSNLGILLELSEPEVGLPEGAGKSAPGTEFVGGGVCFFTFDSVVPAFCKNYCGFGGLGSRGV